MSAIAEVPGRVLAAQLNLQQAWDRASSKSGMAGADGVRVSRFAKNAAANLRVLESRLARETYRPHPLRAAELEKEERLPPAPTNTVRCGPYHSDRGCHVAGRAMESAVRSRQLCLPSRNGGTRRFAGIGRDA